VVSNVRIFMGVVKNRHGTFVVRRKVPDGHEEAVAKVIGDGRSEVSWLQRSLRTKDRRQANTAALPYLIEFDAILAKAAALLNPIPRRDDLSDGEVTAMADYFYASLLSEDDEVRSDGFGSQEIFRAVAAQLADHGEPPSSAFDPNEATPPYGKSEREFAQHQETVEFVLPAARTALARGDITFVEDELDELMSVFRINLDPPSKGYRMFGSESAKWRSNIGILVCYRDHVTA
jgi:hypothetical protein